MYLVEGKNYTVPRKRRWNHELSSFFVVEETGKKKTRRDLFRDIPPPTPPINSHKHTLLDSAHWTLKYNLVMEEKQVLVYFMMLHSLYIYITRIVPEHFIAAI